MSVGLQITMPELPKIAAELREMGRQFSERVYLQRIANKLLKWVNDNFKAEGTEAKWAPLSPNTIARRRKGSSKILQDTGRLRESFVSNYSESGQWAAVGTEDERAPWHHYGTAPYTIRPVRSAFLRFLTAGGWRSAKKVKHPGLAARPLLPSRERALELAWGVLTRYVDQLLKKESTSGGD